MIVKIKYKYPLFHTHQEEDISKTDFSIAKMSINDNTVKFQEYCGATYSEVNVNY